MTTLPDPEVNPNGLHQRYNITKRNGEPVDPMASYFLLRIDGLGRDHHHRQACRAAALAYAKHVADNPDAKHLKQVGRELESMVLLLESMD